MAQSVYTGTIREPCPIMVDSETILGDPFCFRDWITERRQQMDKDGKMAVFDTDKHQLQASQRLCCTIVEM